MVCDQPATGLWWDMGVGKSRTVVETVCELKCLTTLIFAPLSVVPVWPDEFEKWGTREVQVVALDKGTTVKRALEVRNRRSWATTSSRPVVIVMNYEATHSREMQTAVMQPWDLVVTDESHRIKAPRGKTSLLMSHLRPYAHKRICLSGTPLPHDPMDAFAQYRFLDPRIFGRYITHFRARYCEMNPYIKGPAGQLVKVARWVNMDEFDRKFYSIAFRVEKSNVLPGLPTVVHQQRVVTLCPKARRAYLDLKRHFVTECKAGAVTASNVLAKLVRLQQVTSGFLPVDVEDTGGTKVVEEIDTSKRAALAEILDDLPPSEPVVVFYLFRHDADKIREAAQKTNRVCYELSGQTKQLAEWQKAPAHHSGANRPIAEGDVLAAQIRAGGLGVDLTRACYVVYWNTGFVSPGEYDQTEARVHRMGQTRPVTYIHLIAAGTIDEHIQIARRQRRDVVKGVLEGIDPEIAGQICREVVV